MNQQPPQSVLEAFGAGPDLRILPGGRGTCFEAGDIIFKPSENHAESQWVGEFTTTVIQNFSPTTYRLANPLKNGDSFTLSGWTASTRIAGGSISPLPWSVMLHTSQNFHADVKKLRIIKPAFLEANLDRFHEADRVTWNEKPLRDVNKVNDDILGVIATSLERLEKVKHPIHDLTCQIIHGDLTGNILFEDQSPPGIIDMTVYWRPAEYAEAIIVADGLIGHGQGRELINMFATDMLRLQLLVRALYWRALCFAIDPDLNFVQTFLPRMRFSWAASLVEETWMRMQI